MLPIQLMLALGAALLLAGCGEQPSPTNTQFRAETTAKQAEGSLLKQAATPFGFSGVLRLWEKVTEDRATELATSERLTQPPIEPAKPMAKTINATAETTGSYVDASSPAMKPHRFIHPALLAKMQAHSTAAVAAPLPYRSGDNSQRPPLTARAGDMVGPRSGDE